MLRVGTCSDMIQETLVTYRFYQNLPVKLVKVMAKCFSLLIQFSCSTTISLSIRENHLVTNNFFL